MPWSFAVVNNRLAEIYFDRKKNGRIRVLGHCYVRKEEYKTKQEQKWIQEDTKRLRVVYRGKKYRFR
jgi:hypothetical protein